MKQYIDIFLPRDMLFPRDDYRDRHKKIMVSLLSQAFVMKAVEEDSNQDLFKPGPRKREGGSGWKGTFIDKVRKAMYYFPSDDASLMSSIHDLLDDCRQFSKSKEFYRLRGIPFRRSHLLTGPAQCGKIYLVRHIAAILGRGICIIDFADPYTRRLTDADLSSLVQYVSHKYILVLRNIDVAVSASAGGAGRSTGDDEGEDSGGDGGSGMLGSMFRMNRRPRVVTSKNDPAKYTYSGILNILDGPRANTEGVITFVTTRRYQKLLQDHATAGALLRPGRCEMRIHLDTPTACQVKASFRKMFTEVDEMGNEERRQHLEKHAEKFVETCIALEREYEDRKRNSTEAQINRQRDARRGGEDDVSPSFWRTFAGWEEIQNYFKDHRDVEREKTNGLSDVVEEDHVKKFLRASQSARRHKMFELTKEQLVKVRRGNQLSLESTSGQEKAKDIVLDAHHVLGQVLSLATNITTLDELLDSDWCTALDIKLHKRVTVLRTRTRELENRMVLSAFDETSVDRVFSSSSVESKKEMDNGDSLEEHFFVGEEVLRKIFGEKCIPPVSFDRMFEEMLFQAKKEEKKEQVLAAAVVSRDRFDAWLETLEEEQRAKQAGSPPSVSCGSSVGSDGSSKIQSDDSVQMGKE